MNNNLLKRIIFLTVFIFISILSSFSQMDMETHTIKKEQGDNGKTVFFYYNKYNKLIKKITLLEDVNDGIRDGIAEVYQEDTLSNEYQRSVVVYKKGLISEGSYYNRDSILTLKRVYKEGLLVSSLLLIDIDSSNNLHYVKKVFKHCNFMQYNMINDVVIDSVYFKHP